ncbi:DUF2637 domain-containing protein [Microlunatus sp. Y2014]|uniref:DUF2637 domain-containing protein n=1 Tax=Microlunatus sp. Y2014 TaxID=3418488 RepID=UPI003DA75DFC
MSPAQVMDGPVRRGRVAVGTATVGTVLIAGLAFWLSFTALTNLAQRSGVADRQAWAWPLIVDGLIVVATVAVVALDRKRAAWYPWLLLMAGTAVSVTANALHATVAADPSVPGLLPGCVAAVPPMVLLASTHLTVVLVRSHRAPGAVPEEVPSEVSLEELEAGEDAVPSAMSGTVGLQAHYADAISLSVLKKEQHRIEGMLTDIDQRLSAYRDGREDAKLRLRAYLHLATNAHTFYLACDDARRRLCNQAFFTKITLKENLDVTSEFTGIYETILDPTNRLHAEFWQRTGQLHPGINLEHNEETLPHDQRGRVGTSTKWWS